MIHLDTFSRASVSAELWSYEVNSSAIRCNGWKWHHKEKLRLRILHINQDALYEITTSVNSMYGVQLLFLIVSTFIEIATNLYYSVNLMMCGTEVSVHNVFNILLPILWALIYFVELFFITGSCSSAKYEANRSTALLQKHLLVLEHNADTASEIRLFLSQFVHRKFTPWDFFSINYTILGSIVGSVTTLLVILV
jgi:hypothetical protein